MTAPYITADVNPLILYLVIVVVWSVLKKISGKGRKKPEDEVEAGPAEAAPRNMEEGLREFIETVTGQKLPRPEPPPKPPVAPDIKRSRPIVRESVPAQAAPPQVTRQRKRADPRPTPTPALSPDHYKELHTPGTVEITQSQISDAIQDELDIALGKMTALTRMPSMRLAMPALRLSRPSDSSRIRFRVKLTDRMAVREAIVHRVVLGPPRAMGSDYDENQLSL